MVTFATKETLENKYALTAAQSAVADVYLLHTSITIKELLAREGKSAEQVDSDVLEMVTIDAAYRALSAVTNQNQVSQYTQSAVGYSETYTFSSNSGDIYLTKKEKQLLGIGNTHVNVIMPHIGRYSND